MVGEEWVELSNICEIKHGFAFDSDYFSNVPNDLILLTPGNFHVDYRLYFGSNTKYYDGPVPDGYTLENGDLLVVMTDLTKEMAILGSSVIMKSDKKVLHNQRIGKLSVDETKASKVYLNYSLNLPSVRKKIKETASGTTVRHTSPSRILAVKHFLPPLPQQIKIAKILSAWDKSMEATERLLENSKKRKKALMQQLLTGKKRLPGFKQPWSTTKLSTLCEIRRGASPRPISDPSYFSDSGRGWVRISDVTSDETPFFTKTSQYLSPLGESKSVKVDDGDLIMSICATIGVPKFVKIPACIHDGFVVFRNPSDSLSLNLLYYVIQFITDKLDGEGQPGTQRNLNTSIVGEIQFPKISVEEQEKIAEIFKLADSSIGAINERLKFLRKEKDALMQQLLTGKKRVCISEAI